MKAMRTNPITAFPAEAYRTPVFRTRSRFGGVLGLSEPAAIERVLVDNVQNYRKSPQQQRRLVPALGDGLLTAEGEVWRSERRIAAPLFSPRAVTGLFGDMADAAGALADSWHTTLTPGGTLDLTDEYQALTYDIVSRTVFSGSLDGDRLHLHEHMAVYFDTIGRVDLATFLNLPRWVPTVAGVRAGPSLRVFRRTVARAVAERRRQRAEHPAQAHDLLDRLIEARDPQTGLAMPNELVFDNALTVLAAGHETSANALTWISYLLAAFPWADEALLAELRGLGGRPVRHPDLDRLPFARAVVEEAMRLYPPVPFLGRQALGPDTLSGEAVERGDNIFISPWLVHRHRALWEEPDLFAPERFLGERRGQIPRGAYLPFGLGPRTCIGQAFAMQEILTVLAVLLPRFRFGLPDGDMEVMPQSRITLRPRGGMRLTIAHR